MYRHNRATAGIPPAPKLPQARQPKRKLGVVDLIRLMIGAKASEIDKMQLDGDADPKMAALMKRAYVQNLFQRNQKASRVLNFTSKTLKSLGLEIGQTRDGDKWKSTLIPSYSYRDKIRQGNRAVQKARAAALTTLYTAALLDTMGMDEVAAGKYLRGLQKKVEAI